MRKKNVWKQTIALVLAAAIALGNGTPLHAAAEDAKSNTATEGTTETTPGNNEAYQALTFDFNDAVLTTEVTSSDGQQENQKKIAKCVANNVTFISNMNHTDVELVDAPKVEGDTTQRGKALKFNNGTEKNTFLTTEAGALVKYDYSTGVKISMDVYLEEAQDSWNYLFSFGQMDPDKNNVRGTVSFITMSQDDKWNGYWPADGWVENNKIKDNDLYLLQEEQLRKWYTIEYIFTENGLTITPDGDPVVAQPDKADSMKKILGTLSN